MLYAAKCFWPGITPQEFERGARLQLSRSRTDGDGQAAYVGSIVFADDELVLCLFRASSASGARRSAELARIPCERIMESTWFPADRRSPLNLRRGR
jgi:hypothetical protein